MTLPCTTFGARQLPASCLMDLSIVLLTPQLSLHAQGLRLLNLMHAVPRAVLLALQGEG